MSNAGQAALTIVGTVVGAYFGAPQLGYAIGSLAGQALFPTIIGAPKLTDSTVSSSTEGSPIPLLYGVSRIAASLNWARPIQRNKSGGGKGPPQQQGYTDTITAMYAIGEGPIKGVLRIWVNKKLRYDIRPGVSMDTYVESVTFARGFTFYSGSDTQLPDSTMESFLGVGNVPAFRGLSYIVFHDLDITKDGPRAPLIEVEYVQVGTDSTSSSSTLATDALFAWNNGGKDARSCANDHEYYIPGTGWTSDPAALATYMGANTVLYGYSTGNDQTGSFGAGVAANTVSPYQTIAPTELESLFLHFNSIDAPVYVGTSPGTYPQLSSLTTFTNQGLSPGTYYYWATGSYQISGLYYLQRFVTGGGAAIDPPPDPSFGGYFSGCSIASGGPYDNALLYRKNDFLVQVRRKVRKPDNPCHPRCQTNPPTYPGNPDYCVIGGQVVADAGYTLVTGSYKWLADYTLVGTTPVVTQYPLGPVVLSGSAQDTKAFWDAAEAAALAAGLVPAGRTYNAANTGNANQYPIAKGYAWNRTGTQATIIPTPVTLSNIATAISLRAGLQSSELAYTALTQVIDGYFVARLSSGREMLTPLLQFAFSDIIEDGAQLVGVVRGGASVITITEDDLAAREAGGATPPRITVQRTQPAELPRQMRVHYRDNGNDYQAGMQAAAREYGQPRNPVDIELAISMAAGAARKCAQIYLDEAYAGREQYTPFSLPATDAFIALKPSDTITLPVDGQSRLARITSRDYQFPGLLTFNAVRLDAAVYTSNPASTPATGTGNVVVVPGPTSLLYLDIPLMLDTDNDAGAYFGLIAYLSGWSGATINRSSDGGATYDNLGSGANRAPYGTIAAALPAAPAEVYDTRNVLKVTMATGTLSSITYAQLSGTANYAAVGADGRWEIIQYRDAVLQMDGSYLVSFLARGQRGSESMIGSSLPGDLFVPLGLPLQRLSEGATVIGQSRLAKAVTYGTALADAPTLSYTVDGLALKPYAPCHLGGGRNAAGDIALQWTRRGRLSNTLRNGIDVPIGEDLEQYVVEILFGTSIVLRTITVTGATTTIYTAAQQTADFGATQSSLLFRVAQVSAQFGRGYPAIGRI